MNRHFRLFTQLQSLFFNKPHAKRKLKIMQNNDNSALVPTLVPYGHLSRVLSIHCDSNEKETARNRSFANYLKQHT